MSVTLIGLLKPVPLLVGAATIAMFGAHGQPVPGPEDRGDLRIRRAVPRLIAAFFVLNTVVVVGMLLSRDPDHDHGRRRHRPDDFPAAALVAILMRTVRQARVRGVPRVRRDDCPARLSRARWKIERRRRPIRT